MKIMTRYTLLRGLYLEARGGEREPNIHNYNGEQNTIIEASTKYA